jgi:hypothetical protein
MTGPLDFNPVLLYVAYAVLWVCAGCTAAFPVIYHVRSRGVWRSSAVGTHLMSLGMCLTTMLVLTATSRWFPVNFTLGASIVLYIVLSVLMLNQIKMVFRISAEEATAETVVITEEVTNTKE